MSEPTCPHGHPNVPENRYPGGGCRPCVIERERARRANGRAKRIASTPLDRVTYARLDAAANQRGITRASYIRAAITAALEQEAEAS